MHVSKREAAVLGSLTASVITEHPELLLAGGGPFWLLGLYMGAYMAQQDCAFADEFVQANTEGAAAEGDASLDKAREMVDLALAELDSLSVV